MPLTWGNKPRLLDAFLHLQPTLPAGLQPGQVSTGDVSLIFSLSVRVKPAAQLPWEHVLGCVTGPSPGYGRSEHTRPGVRKRWCPEVVTAPRVPLLPVLSARALPPGMFHRRPGPWLAGFLCVLLAPGSRSRVPAPAHPASSAGEPGRPPRSPRVPGAKQGSSMR